MADACIRLVLFQPEIPPNTGNVARLCAATRTPLHLIEPLGFSIDDKQLKRAGLDYWPYVDVTTHPDFEHFLAAARPSRVVLSSAREGQALHSFDFWPGDAVVLGPETRGLPEHMFARHSHRVRIPIWGEVRSLNLSTAAGVLLYQALFRIKALEGL